MARKNSVPNYSELITVTYAALKALGGSGKNDEINNKAAEILGLSDDVLEVPHLNSSSLSEINYRLAWARTLLKRSGAIANSARAVWAISPSFSDVAEVDGAAINKAYQMTLFSHFRQTTWYYAMTAVKEKANHQNGFSRAS